MEKIQLRGAAAARARKRKFLRRGEREERREREPECIAEKKRGESEDMREAREA